MSVSVQIVLKQLELRRSVQVSEMFVVCIFLVILGNLVKAHEAPVFLELHKVNNW